jgi:hypothetical protein
MTDDLQRCIEAEQFIDEITRNADRDARYTQAVMLEAKKHIHRLADALRAKDAAFVERIRAEERERCSQVAEADSRSDPIDSDRIAAAIREARDA